MRRSTRLITLRGTASASASSSSSIRGSNTPTSAVQNVNVTSDIQQGCSGLRSTTTRSISSRSSFGPSSKSKSTSRLTIAEEKLQDHESTFDKAFIHTSSSSSYAQVLPDTESDSWNYHSYSPHHQPQPPPRSLGVPPLENWPESLTSHSKPSSSSTKKWIDRKGKSNEILSDSQQGEFDISPEIIDELYQSSLIAEDDIFSDLTEEEVLGLVEGMAEGEMGEDEYGQDLDQDQNINLDELVHDNSPHKSSCLNQDTVYDPFAPPATSSSSSSTSLSSATRSDNLIIQPQRNQQINSSSLLATITHINHLPTLPPLPVPSSPPDDRTRFDWRSRALSQQKKKSRYNWFGQLPKRKEPSWTKLQFGEIGREELDRYSKHFIPLLEAEQAEEERLFNSRLADWTFDRLKREGYALDELRGSIGYQPKSLIGLGIVYSFVRGKGDRELPFNRFTIGSNVVISRTDPQTDAVGGSDDPKQRLIGSVWHSTKGNVRVMFTQDIGDIESGSWRLDVACSDFAIRRQIEAIKSLNLDPFEQDMNGFPDEHSNKGLYSMVLPTIKAPGQSNTTTDAEEQAIRSVLSSSGEKRSDQTILRGTSLRDLLFRAFQEDYAHKNRSNPSANSNDPQHNLSIDHIVQDQNQLQPCDIDAIPSTTRLRKATTGILGKNQLIQSWTERYRGPGQPLSIEGDPDVGLNGSQMRAMAMMLSERLSLVQGPPGTGKTRVIIETIKLLKKHWQIPHPILVTAHTNVAVDNLLSGLRAHDIKALRFGAINRIPEEYGDWTLDRMIGKHAKWWDLEQARKQKDILMDKKLKMQDMWNGEDEARLTKVGQRIWMIRQSIMREVLLDADVICTTCLSATSKAIQGIDFPIVFLDEASMATEPLSLVPLTKGSSHVAIIGDHKQLPPVIVSPEAHAGGLATSLFERLIHEGNIPSIMLDTQYRMHPELASFPSQTFYSGLLKNGTPSSDRPAPETEFLVKDDQGNRKNITFLNHDHPESPISKSLANYGDAEYVCDVVADLMYKNPHLKGSQIGIITPYLSQLRLLSNHLSNPERRNAFMDLLGEERTRELDDIEIKTVDGFEGREKEMIIFSCVRSNQGGWIGFLGDWRRVNVALTRARKALVMIGSKKTLQQARIGKNGEETLSSGGAKVWRDLISWLESQNLILDVE